MGRTISNGSDPYRYSKSSQQFGGALRLSQSFLCGFYCWGLCIYPKAPCTHIVYT